MWCCLCTVQWNREKRRRLSRLIETDKVHEKCDHEFACCLYAHCTLMGLGINQTFSHYSATSRTCPLMHPLWQCKYRSTFLPLHLHSLAQWSQHSAASTISKYQRIFFSTQRRTRPLASRTHIMNRVAYGRSEYATILALDSVKNRG